MLRKLNYPDDISVSPLTPGVYKFIDENGVIVYIGKAKVLRNRLKSYLLAKKGGKTEAMLMRAKTIEVIETESEFEALLLEANLVSKIKPQYNVALKDDKSPLYIAITDERYPRVIPVRGRDLPLLKTKATYGPFLDARVVKMVLKMIRRILPYSNHKISKKSCIYSELGLCSPCPSAIENSGFGTSQKRELRLKYLNNIRRIKRLLSGNIKEVEKSLIQEMEALSKKENFEEASKVLDKLKKLKYVTSNRTSTNGYLEDPNFLEDKLDAELSELKDIVNKHENLSTLDRIECFDVAHLASKAASASMITFIDGVPDKEYYRHFYVNDASAGSDVDSLKNVLKRRMAHYDDWGRPDLYLIDGGKPQVAAAREILGNEIPVVGLAKRYETLVFIKPEGGFVEVLLPEGPAKKLCQRMRDEAHRFARRLHHKKLTKILLESGANSVKTSSVRMKK